MLLEHGCRRSGHFIGTVAFTTDCVNHLWPDDRNSACRDEAADRRENQRIAFVSVPQTDDSRSNLVVVASSRDRGFASANPMTMHKLIAPHFRYAPSEPASEVHEALQYLAGRRVISLMLAINVQAVGLAGDLSRSFARRRHLPSHVKLRSTVSHVAPLVRATMANATRENFEALCRVGALDDLDGPVAMASEGGPRFTPGIAGIGEHVTQPGEAIPDSAEDVRSAIAVLDARRMDDGKQQRAERVGHDVTLAPVDLFTRDIAANSAALGVFDCQSAWNVDPRSASNFDPL